MTTLVLIRLVLDYVDDLDEAVEIAKAYDMHDSAGTSYYYMAADASYYYRPMPADAARFLSGPMAPMTPTWTVLRGSW
mgnify:CR=1 FL=1